jgi:hypothetical protein
MLLAGVGLVGAAAAFSRSANAGQLNPPPGPVTPTQATPVQSLPGNATTQYVISQPGAYVLTANIASAAGKDGISIAASGVTLDLAGFTLSDVLGTNAAIVSNGQDSVTIRNGHIRGWNAGITGSSAGAWEISDLSFRNVAGTAISLTGGAAVRNVGTSGCVIGISLDMNVAATAASHCTVAGGRSGIAAAEVTACVVTGLAGPFNVTGIFARIASDCRVESFAGGTTYGIQANYVTGCTLDSITSTGSVTAITGEYVADCNVSNIGQTGGIPGPNCAGILGTTVRGCLVTSVIGNSNSTVAGIANGNGLVANCTVYDVRNVAPGGNAFGISTTGPCTDCSVTMLITTANETGINGFNARITGNQVQGGVKGIQTTGKSFVAGNFVTGSVTGYAVDVATTLGPLTLGGGTIATTNPWANFYVP